jgi:hypothetical protein
MIQWLLSLSLFIAAFSAPAFASSAYREENCQLRVKRNKTLNLFADGADAPFVIQGADQDFDLDATYVDKKGARADGIANDLQLKVIVDRNSVKSIYDDGCYAGRQGRFERNVIVDHVSEKAAAVTGLKANMKLSLSCEWVEITPKDSCLDAGTKAARR